MSKGENCQPASSSGDYILQDLLAFSFRSTTENSRPRADLQNLQPLLMLRLRSQKLWAHQRKTLSKRALHSSEQYIRPQVCQWLVSSFLALDAVVEFCSLRVPTRPPKQLSSGAGGAPVFCIVGTSNAQRSGTYSHLNGGSWVEHHYH